MNITKTKILNYATLGQRKLNYRTKEKQQVNVITEGHFHFSVISSPSLENTLRRVTGGGRVN